MKPEPPRRRVRRARATTDSKEEKNKLQLGAMRPRELLAVAHRRSIHLLLLLVVSTAKAHEVTLALSGSNTVPSTTGNAIFGTYPPAQSLAAATPTVLPGVAVFTMDAQCSTAPFAGRAGLDGQTLLLLNGDACRAKWDSLLTALAGLQPTTVRAIICADPPGGDVLPPNFAMLSMSSTPPALRGRWTSRGVTTSSVLQASNAWGQALASHVAASGGDGHVAVEVSPLYVLIEQAGLAYAGSVALGHVNWYLYEHSETVEPLTITVTPTFGNPDLYVRDAASLMELALPGGVNAWQYSQTSPGDDSLTVPLGPQRRAVAIGVFGRLASNFSMVVSSPSTEVMLSSGLPRRFELAANSTQYFAIDADMRAPLVAWITPIAGSPPSLYLTAGSDVRPSAATADAAAVAGPSVAYQRLLLPPGDSSLARCAASAVGNLCRIHLSTVASAAGSFSLVVTTAAREHIRLIDGVPQRGKLDGVSWDRPGGGGSGASPPFEAQYAVRVANAQSNLTLTLAVESGRGAHLVLSTADGAHSWSSEGQGAGQGVGAERLYVSSEELSAACESCDLVATVASSSPAVYTVTATSSHALLMLSDGVPTRQAVSEGAYEHFKFEVLLPSADVEVVVMSLSTSDVDVYASVDRHRPMREPLYHHWESAGHASRGEVLKIRHTDPALAACTAAAGACVLYVSVYGARGDAAFSITATAHDVADGFRVEAPPSIAGAYPFTISGFGPRLPADGLRACAAYASPHDACQPLVDPPHGSYRGKIVLLDRGSTIPGNGVGSCQYPDLQFANKVVRAQEAGAVGVVVVDDQPSVGLINMVATSHDRSDVVAIPSIFTSYQVGALIKAQIADASLPCVSILLRESSRVPTLLVDGTPALGSLHAPDTNGYSIHLYRYISPAGRDDVSITLDAAFGNPDVFVTADGTIPNQQHYTWAAREMGSDTLVIRGHDQHACTMCIYLVAVIAVTGDVSYSLTMQAAETLRSLQPSTPVTAQEVAAGAYLYYRVFVDHTETDGVTIAITPTTGAADIYASFDVERPSALAGQHTWTSACSTEAVHGVGCAPSLASGSAVHIPPGTYCQHAPCLLYVAVRGAAEAASFSILMTFGKDETHAVALDDGGVSQMTLAAAGTVARFTFVAPSGVESFVIDVLPLNGDPDLYVSANTSDWPDRRRHDLMASTSAGETLLVRTSGEFGLCAGCEYKLVVYAFAPQTEFLISVTTSVGVRLLSDGVPALGEAREGATSPLRYFRYFVRTASDVSLVLTPLSGNPSLFARFGCRPLAEVCDYASATAASGGSAASHTWSSTRDDGVESIVISARGAGGAGGAGGGGASTFCAPPCTLYVGVRAEGGANASFSLLVSQRRRGIARLVDGLPQQGVASPYELVYYTLTYSIAAGLTVSLTAFSGMPLLYYSDNTAMRPTPNHHTGSAGAAARAGG